MGQEYATSVGAIFCETSATSNQGLSSNDLTWLNNFLYFFFLLQVLVKRFTSWPEIWLNTKRNIPILSTNWILIASEWIQVKKKTMRLDLPVANDLLFTRVSAFST